MLAVALFTVIATTTSEPTVADDDGIAERIADIERDPIRLIDPADATLKTHLTNRDANLRAYLDDDGNLALEDRIDANAYPRASLSLEGFASIAAPELHDDTVRLGDVPIAVEIRSGGWVNHYAAFLC